MTGKLNNANAREHLFRSLFLATATLGTVAATPMMAAAQEAAEQQEEKKVVTEQAVAVKGSGSTTIEEVEVTGFRKSLADAISAKRLSENITDVISAEDVGKSTDANIAEALQRVTGVSIARSNGEGTTVTVRGVSADLNAVNMNGVALTATGGDLQENGGSNAVNFSQFSSDILAKIEVVKTPSANHDEGSLGAAINLSSFKPLDAARDRRIVDVQGRYAPFGDSSSDGGDSRVSVSLSEKLLDEKLGLSLVASTESQGGRTDSYVIPRYTVHRAGGEIVGNNGVTLPGGYINAETGEHMTEFDYGDGRGPSPLYAHVPFEMFYANDTFNRDRDTVNGAIQFRPTEQTDVLLNLTYSKLVSENESQRFNIRPQDGSPEGAYNLFDPNTQTLVGYRRVANDIRGPGTAVWANPGYVRPQANIEDFTEENKVVSFDIEHVLGDFTFNLSGGHSETTAVDDRVIQSTFQIENQPNNPNNPRENSFSGLTNPGFYSGYECPNGIGSACNIILSADNVANRDPSLGPISDSASEFSFGSLNLRDREIKDTANSVFFDVQWDQQFGPITMVETGLKWSERTKDQRQTNKNYNRFDITGALGLPLSEFSSGNTSSDFGTELGIGRDTLSDGWAAFDPFLAMDSAILNDPSFSPRVTPELVNGRVLTNTVFGGYIKARFEFLDGQLSGDVGARYVHTDVDVAGGASIQLLNGNFTERAENVAYYGSQEAAEEALGADLQPQKLNGVDNPLYKELQGVPVTGEHSYDNLLPSLNLNYALNEDMIVRFAASKTMARPPIDQLNPRFRFVENAFNAQSYATAGNPALEPFESFNLDLSYEWYFADESVFSAALFNKDLSNFTRSTAELYFIRDLREQLYDENGTALDPEDFGSRTGEDGFSVSFDDLIPYDPDNQPENCLPNRENDMSSPVGQIAYGCDVVAYETFQNGDGGYVRGLELGFQHNFSYLPGIWGNFGVMANYTYSDSETSEETEVNEDGTVSVTQLETPFPETSLHTYNGTVYYEDEDYLVRLAYNKRTDYLLDANVLGGYAHYREGFDTLDLSAAWNITDKLQLNFQGVNLLDTVTRDYAVFTGLNGDENLPGEEVGLGDAPSERTIRLQNSGPIYRLGLRYNF